MKHGEKMLMCLVAGLALCTAAQAVSSDSPAGNPYQGIVERNVFGLKPPPPPPDPEANKPPPPKIILQGITTFGGIKRALLKAQMPAKPGDPAKGEQSFILAEGQRDGDIEVLEISDKPGSEFVKVNDFGTITNLTFEDNGIKTASAAAPGPQPNPAGFGGPKPGPNPFSQGGGGANSPVRPMRMPGMPGAAASPSSGGATPAYATSTPAYGGSVPAYSGGASVSAGAVTLPGFNTPVPAVSQPQPQNTAPPLTAEEQAIILAAQKQRYLDAGSPIANLFPPTLNLPGQTPAASGNPSGTTTPKPWVPPRAPSLPPLPQ